MAVKDKKRRLFFALWPSAQVRESIVETASPLLQEMAGRIIQPKNLHITLHFIGSVDDDKKDCLHEAALSVIAQPFDLSLDCFGHFSKAKIFWMSAEKIPVELSRLYQTLGKALSVCDYHQDQRPYAPHVTLLRKSVKPVLLYEDFSIFWRVDEFVLVESVSGDSGVKYQVVETYSLL
ncbi:MAG: RNA 2',3'-cyclic phosphodiesterase [Proteobacteria bacterium]|nr:RNA 2',3'-cyclic phosphodiesterase [Pseudomonadota bacterium]